ncbi:MAG: FecR family protein, partial [Pontibacterium sp.]
MDVQISRITTFFLLLNIATFTYASELVGNVVLSVGDNYAINLNGKQRKLVRNGDLYQNDTITTSAEGRVHMKLIDDTTISLKPDTRFRIATYLFNAEKAENNAAFFQLLKGGLRTVSGEIGKLNPKRRRMQTMLATIGIRGTEYELYVCDAKC